MADLSDWYVLKERAENMLGTITPEDADEVLPAFLGGYMGIGAALATYARTAEPSNILYEHITSILDKLETLRMERENGIT